jgi:hypothetical protein
MSSLGSLDMMTLRAKSDSVGPKPGLAPHRFSVHTSGMSKAYFSMPLVEVTGPDGSRELWAVASSHDEAVGIVQKLIPEGFTATPSSRRLPAGEKIEGLCRGEARRIGS